MKTINKIFAIILVSMIGILVLNSCSEDAMDRANERKYRAETVPTTLELLQGILAAANSVTGSDLSLYANIYMELEGGAHNQFYDAELRLSQPTDMSIVNNQWNACYYNVMTVKDVIKRTSEDGDAPDIINKGIAHVLYAHTLATLTDCFGDIPWKQTAEFDELDMPLYLTPEIDSQESAYEEIMVQLDKAIECLKSSQASRIRNEDPVYLGDKAKWLKAAYGLKARYTLQKINRSTSKDSDYDAILGYINNSFTSAAEEFSFRGYTNTANSFTPLVAVYNSRQGMGVSQSFTKKITARNDYRYLLFDIKNTQVTDPANFSTMVMIDNGVVSAGEGQTTYTPSMACRAGNMPVHMMSYHELLFIKAEVQQRKGQTAGAKETLKEAIKAAYINQNGIIECLGYSQRLTADLAEDYFDNHVSARFDASPMSEIIIEKYMACHGPSGESLIAYNDYRRLKAEGNAYVVLENPENGKGKFPLRYPYGTSDATTNPNIKNIFGDGSYVYSENVWWAGGNR